MARQKSSNRAATRTAAPVSVDIQKLHLLLPKISELAAFQRDIVGAIHWLEFSLRDRESAQSSDAGRLFQALIGNLLEAAAAIRQLPELAIWSLHRQMKRRASRSRFPFGANPGNHGVGNRASELRLELESELERLRDAAKSVWLMLDRPRRGRPPNPEADEAIKQLIMIWHDQTGKRPTLSTDPTTGKKRPNAFLTFCDSAILPVYKAAGREPPGIAGIAKKLLYPGKTAARG